MSDYMLLEERALLTSENRLLKDEIKFLKSENLKLKETQRLGTAEMHGLHDAYITKLKESSAFLESLNVQLHHLGDVAGLVLNERNLLDGDSKKLAETSLKLETMVRDAEASYGRHLEEFVLTVKNMSDNFISSAGDCASDVARMSKTSVEEMKQQATLVRDEISTLLNQIVAILERPRANDGLERQVLLKLDQKLGT